MKRKQLLICSDAVVRTRQHEKPCSDCPWSRKSLPGWLGSPTAADWISYAHGEAKVDCHTIVNRHCAGIAIYRANVVKTPRDPLAFKLPANTKLVFASPAEFMEHHKSERG